MTHGLPPADLTGCSMCFLSARARANLCVRPNWPQQQREEKATAAAARQCGWRRRQRFDEICEQHVHSKYAARAYATPNYVRVGGEHVVLYSRLRAFRYV